MFTEILTACHYTVRRVAGCMGIAWLAVSANFAYSDASLVNETLAIDAASFEGRIYRLNLSLVDAEQLVFRANPDSIIDITSSISPLQALDGDFDGSVFTLHRVAYEGQYYQVRLDLVAATGYDFVVNHSHTRMLDATELLQPPQATAGNDQSVTRNSRVSLAGGGVDADGSIVAFQWRQVSGPIVDLEGTSVPVLTLETPGVQEPTLLQFELQVTDDEGLIGADLVNILVEPVEEVVSLPNCKPFVGPEVARFKVLFVNLGDSPNFDPIVNDAIYNQFRKLAPFNEFQNEIAFSRLALENAEQYNCRGSSGSLSGSGFVCDNDLINQAIEQACAVENAEGLIKIVITESDYGGSGGEVIYIGDRSPSVSYSNIIIHEVGHNLGLADLYGGGYRFSGEPIRGWPSYLSRQWLNLDGPGCPTWCESFKSPSEYTISTNAVCPAFTSKSDCLAFNRDAGHCRDADGDGAYDCCTWSETSKEDYFQTSCAPVWGVEDIGLQCTVGTGCYFGGAYGNNSWRPVLTHSDSIMYSPTASKFDQVSENALRDVLKCCYSDESASSYCAAFRSDFSRFLTQSHPFKERLGSCLEAPGRQWLSAP